MPQWLKIVLVLVCLAVLGLGALIGAGAWWVSKNKDRLIEGGNAARAEGAAFGQSHTKDECVGNGVARLGDCAPVDLLCEATNKIRMQSCFSTASGELPCTGVPGRTDIMKSVVWLNQECARRGAGGSQACTRLIQGVIEACAETKP